MRILITGAAGRLGSELIRYLGSEYAVIGTFRPSQRDLPISCGTAVRVDLSQAEPVAEMMELYQPDVVIHCAAATSVDRCQLDHQYAETGNIVTTQNLLSRIKANGKGRMIYLSTDYVFSGREASPNEEAKPDAINVYGKTKLEGELLVLESADECLVLRVCALYTASPHPKSDPISALYQTLIADETYKAATDLQSNPTEVSDLARAITALVKLKQLPPVLHLAAPEYLSRYQFAVKVAKRLGLNSDLIEPVEFEELHLPAPRPLLAGLSSLHSDKLLGYQLKSLDELPQLVR